MRHDVKRFICDMCTCRICRGGTLRAWLATLSFMSADVRLNRGPPCVLACAAGTHNVRRGRPRGADLPLEYPREYPNRSGTIESRGAPGGPPRLLTASGSRGELVKGL